jgi:hypothetical protein
MISAILINPQVFYKDGKPFMFEQTCIFYQDGVQIDRTSVSFPWAKTDQEVEAFILSKCEEKAIELNGSQFVNSLERWDWPIGLEETVTLSAP